MDGRCDWCTAFRSLEFRVERIVLRGLQEIFRRGASKSNGPDMGSISNSLWFRFLGGCHGRDEKLEFLVVEHIEALSLSALNVGQKKTIDKLWAYTSLIISGLKRRGGHPTLCWQQLEVEIKCPFRRLPSRKYLSLSLSSAQPKARTGCSFTKYCPAVVVTSN